MKFALLTFLMISTLFSESFANEQKDLNLATSESVPAQLKLLGRGLTKRGSNDSVALACYDEACSTVRFVRFTNQNAQWIGSAFAHSSDDLEIERLRLQQYLLARTPEKLPVSETRAWRWVAPGLVFVVVPVGAKIATAMALSTGPALVLFLGPTLAFIAVDNLIYSHRNRSLVYQHQSVPFTVSNGENGWNWSENPIRISGKRYDKMLGIITSGELMNPTPALQKITDKIKTQEQSVGP